MAIEILCCQAVPEGYCVTEAPVGRWWLEWCSKGLLGVHATDARPGGDTLPQWLSRAWNAFWSGRGFSLTLCTPRPVAPFFMKVYQQLAQVFQGDTLSYGDIAELCGSPKAARAVGQAMRSNPWALFLPCHRVIGAKGALTGYFGTRQLELKLQLLEYERKMCMLRESVSSKLSSALDSIIR